MSTLYRRQKRRLDELLVRHKPDIVHAQGADIGGYLAVGSGVPAIVTVHGLLAACASYQTDPASKLRALLAARFTERRTVRRARHVIAISPYVARYYGDAITGHIYEVPNPVADSFFSVSRKPEPGRILYAGRIANGKGILELLRAVECSGDAVTRLVLAGAAPDPAYEALVRREIARLGLSDRVKLAGLLDEQTLLQEFGRAAALVLPSFQETAPMVVQQAMASGLAVIATRVGGIPFQIEHDVTGWMCDAGNVGQLASLMKRLRSDESAGHRLGNAAKAVATTRYRADVIAEGTVSVYRQVLSGSHGAGFHG